MSIADSILESVFGGNDRGCDWYCDKCNAFLNKHPGFTVDNNVWVCTACGYENDVSEDAIIYEKEDEFTQAQKMWEIVLKMKSIGRISDKSEDEE